MPRARRNPMSKTVDGTVVRLKDFRPTEVRQQVSQTLSSLGEQLSNGVRGWSGKARTAFRSTDRFVRDRPWQVLGVLTAVGVAAGILTRSQRRARQMREEDSISSG